MSFTTVSGMYLIIQVVLVLDFSFGFNHIEKKVDDR